MGEVFYFYLQQIAVAPAPTFKAMPIQFAPGPLSLPLLAQAAELAIRENTESISIDLLDQAAGAGIYKLPARQEEEVI
ncbi:MAG TPA: hypothetical protein PLT94_14020 [Rhodocyclaceae bacterium]|nr:hypothetical protein [Rhodocyclaceae bacterium]HNB79641.1 hypothetical protein [Rhodocyclaceae bacterium]HNC67882.1 hypothetical protein [Thauera aminoaromatica]HNG81361.1 hypothetical protein [Burkholderiaceae bacterium]HNH64193.1 hypothetical protein [Thauera aminoaromatica]